LAGGRLHEDEEVEMAVGDWLRMQEPDFYSDGIFKLVPRWDNASMCSGIMMKNNDTSAE
jgi:hypothetical protein